MFSKGKLRSQLLPELRLPLLGLAAQLLHSWYARLFYESLLLKGATRELIGLVRDRCKDRGNQLQVLFCPTFCANTGPLSDDFARFSLPSPGQFSQFSPEFGQFLSVSVSFNQVTQGKNTGTSYRQEGGADNTQPASRHRI